MPKNSFFPLMGHVASGREKQPRETNGDTRILQITNYSVGRLFHEVRSKHIPGYLPSTEVIGLRAIHKIS